MNTNVKYRPDIDGLRAIAVLPVMLFHAGIELFSGGYVGVDVFFVISGYLMTSIIYKEVLNGKFSYAKFYERRARRIFPALYFIIFISIFPAWFLLVPDDFVDFSDNVIGAVTFSSNIILWLQSNYFDQVAELKPLLHTWSLSVEEQYYVFLPILLILIHKIARKLMLLSIFTILVLSLVLSQWGAYSTPTANYYLLPTRAWELFIGSFVSILLYTGKLEKYKTFIFEKSRVIGTIGLILIMVPVVLYDSDTPFPSLWTLPPTLGTALIIICSNPNTLTYKILSSKILVGIGLISYSAYLWHQPVYAYTRQQPYFDPSQNLLLIAFLVSLIFAFISWKFVEQPFRNKTRISTRSIWTFSVVGALGFIIFGLLSSKNNGFENRFDLREPLTKNTFDLPKKSNGWCFYSVDTNQSLSLGKEALNCHVGDVDSTKQLLLFGDSFAGMYEPFWDVVGEHLSVDIHSVTTNWCHPSLSDSFWWNQETRAKEQCDINREFVQDNVQNYDAVIISAVWLRLENEGVLKEIYEFINYVTREKRLKIIIMPQPPKVSRQSVLRSVYYGGEVQYEGSDEKVRTINSDLKAISSKNKNVLYLERESLFSTLSESKLLYTNDSLPYSWDGGHLSIYGSNKAGENFVDSRQYILLKQFLK
ncbi:MAG: acyltransferase [Gammaproteobacteria bacterium]|nr:acyltransferase [Gammaproteobacteria bacterium]